MNSPAEPKGFDVLRHEIDRLSELDDNEFKANIQIILRTITTVMETINTEFKSGQETSGKAFRAITEAIQTLTRRFDS